MIRRFPLATRHYKHSSSSRTVPLVGLYLDPGDQVTRSVVLIGAVLLFIAGASGILVTEAFHQYSTLKWIITVAGPALIILLLLVKRPSAWAAGLVIFTVPIEPYVSTIHNQPVSILLVTLLLATLVVTIEGGGHSTGTGRKSALGTVTPWVALLLVIPTVLGASIPHEVLYFCLLVDLAWICTRVVALYPDGRLLVVLLFLGSAGAQSAFALIQYVTGHQFNLYGGAGSASYSAQNYFFNYGSAARTTGTFFDPISLGNVLAMALPLALLVLLRGELRTRYRGFAGLIALLLIGGMAVSLSRASWMAAVAGILCIAAFSRGHQRRRAFVLSGSLIVAALLIASTLYGPAIEARFTSILDPTASTVRTASGDKAREVDWSFALHIFTENPIFGVGIGNLALQFEASVPGSSAGSHASDVYLQYLAEGGVCGGAVLLLLAGGISVDLFRSRRTDWLYPGLVGSFVGVSITWVTDYTVRYYAVAGCLAVLVGLAASSSHRPGKNVLDVPTGPSVPSGLSLPAMAE